MSKIQEVIQIREDNGSVKNVGTIWNRCFYKKVSKKRHFFQKGEAWGIDSEVFDKTVSIECDFIKIYDKDEDKLYECTIGHFKALSDFKHFKPHRSQQFLNIKYFEITENYEKNKPKL